MNVHADDKQKLLAKADSLVRFGDYYASTSVGNYEKAINAYNEALRLCKAIDPYSENVMYINDQLLYILCISHNYNEAIKQGNKALKIREEVLGRQHCDNVSTLSNLANSYQALGDFEHAIKLHTETLEITAEALGCELPLYTTCLNNLANCYLEMGNKVGDAEFLQPSFYANYADLLSLNYIHNQHYNKVLEIAPKGLSCVDSEDIDEHTKGVIKNTLYMALAQAYEGQKNYEQSAIHYKESLLYIEHTPDNKKSDILSLIGKCYALANMPDSALVYYEEAAEMTGELSGKEHLDYALLIGNIATYYPIFGNYEKSISLLKEALRILEKTQGKQNSDYAYFLNFLALVYADKGDYGNAIAAGKETLEIRKRVLEKDAPEYATSLSNLASFLSDIGNYSEAIILGKEALEIHSKLLGQKHPEYIADLNNLAFYMKSAGNLQDAINLGEKALLKAGEILGKNHEGYVTCIHNLALYMHAAGNYKQAIELGKEDLVISENLFGKKHVNYFKSLNCLAVYLNSTGNFEEAIRLNEENLEKIKNLLGKKHPCYTSCLSNLIESYRKGLHTANFVSNFLDYIAISRLNILNVTLSLAKENRTCYWNVNKYLYDYYCPNFAYRYKKDELVSCAYYASLFSKAFLLNSDLEVRNIIYKSNDSTLLALFDSLTMNKRILAKLYEKPIIERSMKTDSLEEVSDKIERELMFRSKEYVDLSHNLRIQMEDVKEKLASDDVAIEFQSFPMLESESDSIMYTALVLKKEYDSPHLIPLFEEKQLSTIPTELLYTTDTLYNLVWKPLEEEMQGCRNVYFSPSGVLYNTNIEVVPEAVRKLEGTNFYRLSSTRQLAYIKDGIEGEGAAIFGGLAYDLDEDKMQEERSKTERTPKERSFTDFDLRADSIDVRGGAGYLPYTREEAIAIHNTMTKEQGDSSILLYTGSEGIEETFKALDGKRKKIIHLSTHGFYYKENDAEKMKKAGLKLQFMMDDNRPRYVEDKQLTRSGLMLSGCNNVLRGKEVPEGADDGILYAKEIAAMDLRGLDLVSLSACQTGLGDISGEGVFGLQRAFKKAGAQSILMSLWKVDDNATMLFMTRFYENYLTKKMTKVEALHDAQEYIKQQGYTNPRDWAAFILLDAI